MGKKTLVYKKDVTVLGNYNKTKINVGPHMFKILIEMYKNPIASIVREITSNAIDATIEAKVDKPVIVSLNGNKFTIQDFGIGISPERAFNYFNFGYSSKLEDDEQIGAYGLGAKCVLAYKDNIIVETNYNGIKYKYNQFIDKDGIPSYYLIKKEKTEEKNGTKIEIEITDKDDIKTFKTEMQNLRYNKNVILIVNNKIINKDDKIYDYDDFVIGNWEEDGGTTWTKKNKIFLLRQGIKYPLDPYQMPDNRIFSINTIPIGIKIDLDIPVTPSRDNIIYNKETINIIQKKINKIYDFLIEEKQKQNTVEVNNYYELLYYLHQKNNKIKLGEKYYNFISLEKDKYICYKNDPDKLNLSLLRENYFTGLLYDFSFMKIDYRYYATKKWQYKNNIEVLADNYETKILLLNVKDARRNIETNKEIDIYMSNNFYKELIFFKKRDKFIKYYRKLFNEILKDIKDRNQIYKILRILIELEKEYFSDRKKYDDFKVKKVKQKKVNKKIIIGNIYPLHYDNIKRKKRLDEYKWDSNYLYILGENSTYEILKSFNSFTKTYKLDIKTAVLPKTFISKIPDDIDYIYLTSDKENNIVKINNKRIIKEMINLIYLNKNIDSIPYDRMYYINIFNNKEFYNKLGYKFLYHSREYEHIVNIIEEILKENNIWKDKYIDKTICAKLKDYINFIHYINNLSRDEKVEIYYNGFKETKKYMENLKTLKQKTIFN